MRRARRERMQLISSEREPGMRDGGRLMNARQIADEILGGHVSPEWVRRNVPGKITLGHSTVMWHEDEVWEWVNSRREGGM